MTFKPPKRGVRSTSWSHAQLVDRALRAIDAGNRVLEALQQSSEGACEHPIPENFPRAKAIAETALLLHAAAKVWDDHPRLRDAGMALARRLTPLARDASVLGAICTDPAQARCHATAHLILSRLGLPHRGIDALLAQCRPFEQACHPELLPFRTLEQHWLSQLQQPGKAVERNARRDLARSALGRPLDRLAGSRIDFYAFTHAVLYATDFGERRPFMTRSLRDIANDADAALAYAIEHDDYDLAAELLLTWPMLGIRWSPTSLFALNMLATIEGELGFVPGLQFQRTIFDDISGPDRSWYALMSSYHTMYVMGFLWTACL
ncbi:MAG: hypothetical protein JO278_11780, partial [Dyella sp.]|nr:hypothetical protein [Dyella sp.]